IDHYNAQRAGYRAPALGGGSIFLIILLVLFGLSATGLRTHWHEIGDNINIDGNDFELFGHNYTFDDSMEQSYPNDANLHVTSERGAVNVNISDDDKIRVTVHKRINAENEEEAGKWNAGTKPIITVSGNTLSVNANTEGAGDHPVATD